jgi:hypothetical protein
MSPATQVLPDGDRAQVDVGQVFQAAAIGADRGAYRVAKNNVTGRHGAGFLRV